MQRELCADSRTKFSDGAASAHEGLHRKDRDAKQYPRELPKMKSKLEEERSWLTSSIEGLRKGIDERNKMAEMELPSIEEMELMRDDAAFTGKHLDANQETMIFLQQQKKSRMEEVSYQWHHGTIYLLVIPLFTSVLLFLCAFFAPFVSLVMTLPVDDTYRYTRRTNRVRNRGARKANVGHEEGD